MSYLDRNIIKYMMPQQAIQYMMNNPDNDTVLYLLRIHFPWMPIDTQGSSYLYLYKQAYLATIGRAESSYQEIYNSYIDPILMDKIGEYFWQNQKIDYLTMYNYIRKSPHLVYDLMRGNIDINMAIKAIQLNSDYDDMEYHDS